MSSATAQREHYLEQLHSQGYVPTGHTIATADSRAIFFAFGALTAEVFDKPSPLGQAIVEAVSVEHPLRPIDSKGFIEQRRVGDVSKYEIGRDPGTDHKDQFHFTPLTYPHAFEYFKGRGGMPRVLKELLDLCVELRQTVTRTVSPILEVLGLRDTLFAPPGREIDDIHVMRFLHYHSSTPDNSVTSTHVQPLADLHFDRSKFTAAVLESRPGLVGAPSNNHVGRPDLTVEEFDFKAERAFASRVTDKGIKLFPGAGYNRLNPDLIDASGRLSPFLHGVVDTDPGVPRLAVVYFMNEFVGAASAGAPQADETGYTRVRGEIASRQERFGGMPV